MHAVGISRDSAVEVRAFEPSDTPRVLEVLEAAFGEWPRGIHSVDPDEFFRWKHMAGPFGTSTIIVAEADGAVVGCHAYMPWRLRVDGRSVASMRGGDLAVRPSHRRLGVSMAMRDAARFPDEIAFMWSHPNKQNRPGAEKAGMLVVNRLPRFLRPRRPFRDGVRRALARGSRTPDHLRVEAATAMEILRDGPRVSLLLQELNEAGGRMATAKDLDYLRWRYGRLDEYRAIASGSLDGHGGVVIFRTRRAGPVWVSDICELLAAHDDSRTIRHLLDLVSAAAPADFIACSFSSRRQAARFGFLPTRGATVLMTLPLHRDLAPDPARPDSWSLCRGDLELL